MSSSDGPIGIRAGRTVPLDQLVVPAIDLGFVHGVTVAEQVRTFHGRPFLLEDHFLRWHQGLTALGCHVPCDFALLSRQIDQVLQHNHRFLPAQSGPTGEQGICFFASPGSSSWGWSEVQTDAYSYSVYSYPLPTQEHLVKYQSGVQLVSVDVTDVPPTCWPPSIKVRSRLHYYLAQQQAQRRSVQSHPILLDTSGYVSDSAIASIVGWNVSQGLVVRPASCRYDSISVRYLIDLAGDLNIPVQERLFTLDEMMEFEELFLVSTPWCIYPVRMINTSSMPAESHGFPVFKRLLQAWQAKAANAGC